MSPRIGLRQAAIAYKRPEANDIDPLLGSTA